MKIDRRPPTPCFGKDAKVDIELLRRMSQGREEQSSRPHHPALSIIAIATSTIAVIILIIAFIRHTN